MKLPLLKTCLLLLLPTVVMAQTINIVKKRPPQLNISAYQKIAVGDIVGSTGFKTERSMDLTDAVSSQLFNSKTYEVIDRNALEEILSSQRRTEIKAIDQTTTAALSKKLGSAIMVIGRIQNEKIYTEQKSVKNIVVSNGCYYSYWWLVTGDITVQIKIIDIKTGRILFTNPVTQPIKLETKQECQPTPLGDTNWLFQDAVGKLATEITKIIIPYNEVISVKFETPLITLFKNPFKKLRNAVDCFSAGNNAMGLEILKSYADDSGLKPDLHEKATFNYAVGLFADNQYDLAAEQFKQAAALGSLGATDMLLKINTEKQFAAKLSRSDLMNRPKN